MSAVDAIDDDNCDSIFEIKWMIYNSFRYSSGYFIHYNNALYQIQKLFICGGEYYFFCLRFIYTEYSSFLNSLEIEMCEPSLCEIIKFNRMENKNVYAAKILNNHKYIILDTLDLINVHINNINRINFYFINRILILLISFSLFRCDKSVSSRSTLYHLLILHLHIHQYILFEIQNKSAQSKNLIVIIALNNDRSSTLHELEIFSAY